MDFMLMILGAPLWGVSLLLPIWSITRPPESKHFDDATHQQATMFYGTLCWEVYFGVRLSTNRPGREDSKFTFIYNILHQHKNISLTKSPVSFLLKFPRARQSAFLFLSLPLKFSYQKCSGC